MSFVGPHSPFDPPTEYADRYRNAEMPAPIPATSKGKPKNVESSRKGLTEAEILKTRRQYCAYIELIDAQIGEILDAVEKRGMMDNTYIIFASDHGEMLGDHGLYGKSVSYEASLRVPLIVAGPGIEGGRVSDEPVELNRYQRDNLRMGRVATQEKSTQQSLGPIFERRKTDDTAHRIGQPNSQFQIDPHENTQTGRKPKTTSMSFTNLENDPN